MMSLPPHLHIRRRLAELWGFAYSAHRRNRCRGDASRKHRHIMAPRRQQQRQEDARTRYDQGGRGGGLPLHRKRFDSSAICSMRSNRNDYDDGIDLVGVDRLELLVGGTEIPLPLARWGLSTPNTEESKRLLEPLRGNMMKMSPIWSR